jgi:hypothetical protein
MDAESLMRIERGTRCLRVFRDQFEIAERGHQRDHKGNHEGQPHDTANLFRDLAGERINPGAENVADDEQQKQPGAHDPVKTWFDAACWSTGVDGDIGHHTSFPLSVASASVLAGQGLPQERAPTGRHAQTATMRLPATPRW